MLKTSHLQEFKRRYASMYAPKEETLDEHCGVCDEQGIEEAFFKVSPEKDRVCFSLYCFYKLSSMGNS